MHNLSSNKPAIVSVIIPCYNAERYVGEAIQSALDQTYPHKEVIVIDDGSTDCSLDVIKSFGISVRWKSGPNRGGCVARNRGLELAKGDLIQFHDADDLLHPEKLAVQVPIAIENPTRIVYCRYAFVDEAGNSISEPVRSVPVFDGEDPVVFVLLQAGLSTPAPLHWKSKLMAIGGFHAGLACAQERDLHLRLACDGASFLHVPKTLVKIRRVSGSVSSNLMHVRDQYTDIVWRAYEQLKTNAALTEPRLAAMAGLLAMSARNYLNSGLVEKSRDYFDQARRLHPEGGIPQAYSSPGRVLHRFLGPEMTQRFVNQKRRIFRCR